MREAIPECRGVSQVVLSRARGFPKWKRQECARMEAFERAVRSGSKEAIQKDDWTMVKITNKEVVGGREVSLWACHCKLLFVWKTKMLMLTYAKTESFSVISGMTENRYNSIFLGRPILLDLMSFCI